MRCGADIALGIALGWAVLFRDHWRSTAGSLEGTCRWVAQPGGDAVLGFRTWPCEPALPGLLTPESASRAPRDFRCPFLSFPFRAVPLHSHSPAINKHPALAAGNKPWRSPAGSGEVEVIPEHSQEVPLKCPAAALPRSLGPAGSIHSAFPSRCFLPVPPAVSHGSSPPRAGTPPV